MALVYALAAEMAHRGAKHENEAAAVVLRFLVVSTTLFIIPRATRGRVLVAAPVGFEFVRRRAHGHTESIEGQETAITGRFHWLVHRTLKTFFLPVPVPIDSWG